MVSSSWTASDENTSNKMAVSMNQEASGFKLLEEDPIDDRPCPAVKKFVSSILDRKDMKDQEVASSFRNLMEYRDSNSSPSACSVATSSSALDGDRLNSPPSPSSPTTVPGPMDDQRLPNELLDEICEDIGMKEGMELDFVEYLMEQDSNPQLYMTQEAISSGAFNSASGSTISTPTGSASGSSNNSSDNNRTLTVLNPASTTTPNFLFKPNFSDPDWLHPFPISVSHSSSSNSSESTMVKSSENNSPANKRVHLSASAETSPNKGQLQTPPEFNQHNYGGGGGIAHGNHNLFKMPHPGPVVAKRSQSYPHGAPTSSPVQSTNSNSSLGSASSISNNHLGYLRPQEFSSLPHDFSSHPGISSDLEESAVNTITNNNNNKNHCMSPKPVIPASSSCDFIKPGSPANQFQGQGHFNSQPSCVGARDGSVFQRVDKRHVPPNINVKSIQQHQQHHYQQQALHPQQRWIGSPQTQINASAPGPYYNKAMYPGACYQTHHLHVNHHIAMGNMSHMSGPPAHHNPQIRTHADSPLDQGYFSNESAGNCSNGSAPSPAFTSSSSISSFSSASTMMPADHNQKFSQKSSMVQQQMSGVPAGRPPGQKSVHFADLPDGSPPAYTQSPGNVSMDMNPSFNSENGTSTDCAFEVESNGQPKVMPSGKILPRFNHNTKSGVAPYTVPNSQGQIMGPVVSQGYDLSARSSCAMSVPGDQSSPGESLQEYASKTSQINGSSNGSFFMDGNQNMMRMDSGHDYPPFPPPLISPQAGEYGGMHPQQPRYGMDQFSSMQQQTPHPQQPSLPSTESMPPLQPHPMQHLHRQHQQPHPFSSCSLSSQGIDSDFGSPHHNNMQITNSSAGSYQVAVSTPISNRANSNPRLGGTYGVPPSYEGPYVPGGPPEMYPQQQPHGPPPPSQVMMSGPQASSIHRSWGPGISGPEDLRVQVGSMHPSAIKGGPHLPHSHNLPHMQPSPTPACAAPMGPGSHMQDMGMMNPGVPGISPHHHPHMDPHPEYGPCVGLPCNACKMAHTATSAQHHHHLGPCSGPNCHACKMTHPSTGPLPPPSGLPHVGPCAGPNCTACKINQASRPQMLSSQQKFIQHLIMDEGNAAYRSHPLFPLLRDLVIAEMNFDNPRFHYQQLLSLLPNDFHKLLQNFLHRNPPSGHYQSNQAVESVIMDSLRLAHSNLVDKIRHRQELEKMKANSSASLRSMEEFCQKFDHSVNGPVQVRSLPNGVGSVPFGNPMGAYHEGDYIQHGVGHLYRSMKDGPDMFGESALTSTSPQANKAESKKHPSLPKEAVAMMMEWLRNHKDNPYPNDDEKAMLIKQTGLSINQINYWFTNARRRILPKWSQCKT